MRSQCEHRMRTTAGMLALLAGLAVCVGCSSRAGPPVAPPMQTYRVGPPDRLGITILPEPIIQRDVVVRPDGMISIDLIGDIPASGRTTEEIAADIERRIVRFKRSAKVTVSLGQSLSTEITVLGEVRRVSTFPLARDTRIIEAIGLVGGPTHFAAKSRIKVIRHQDGKTVVYRVNLSAMENGDLQTNILLQGGDIIVVPPTVSATIGHFVRGFFYPLQQIMGLTGGASTAITGGV